MRICVIFFLCQGWDSPQRKAALAEAEARGELHVEGDKIVFHSLLGALKHMSEVFARRPELAGMYPPPHVTCMYPPPYTTDT